MAGLQVSEESLVVSGGGSSQVLTVTSASAVQSSVVTENYIYLYSTENIFIRQGLNPTALSNGTDMFIPGGVPLRLGGFMDNNKLSLIAEGTTSTVYITQGV